MVYSIDLPSKRLIASYVFDWIAIIGIAAIGGGLNYISPYHRPFSLVDLSISFPLVKESISAGALGLFGLLAPAVIIVIVVALFVPGPRYCRLHTRSEVIRRKLWEWEKGWAGLGLSLATAFFFTQALKNIFGKPRPDLIARCDPDVENVGNFIVASYVADLSPRWSLVNTGICRQQDKSLLDDGFRSFPSGHSSFSWASMLYLSLFLASKFAIAIPFLPDRPGTHDSQLNKNETHELLPLHSRRDSTEYVGASARKPSIPAADPNDEVNPDAAGPSTRYERSPGRSFVANTPLYNQAAAPPVHLVIIVFIPICVAFYVVSTRYVEFYHHGFDIISGSLIGIVAAYGSFRWYHAPIRKGAGWAWGPRSRERAWGVGVGTENYVGDEGWDSASGRKSQILRGRRRGDA